MIIFSLNKGKLFFCSLSFLSSLSSFFLFALLFGVFSFEISCRREGGGEGEEEEEGEQEDEEEEEEVEIE